MAQTSRKVRTQRRLKRRASQATQAAESFMGMAYKSRVTAMALEVELKKRDAALAALEGEILTFCEGRGVGLIAGDLYRLIKAKFEEAPKKEEPNYRGGSVTKQLGAVEPAIYDPVNYPEGAARADTYIAEKEASNDKTNL